MSKYDTLVKFASAIYRQSQRDDVDLNDLDFWKLKPILSDIRKAERKEKREAGKERHGGWLVCYVLDAETESDWEAFDCEVDAVKRYEELTSAGACYTVTIAKPIRSTDYDCWS